MEWLDPLVVSLKLICDNRMLKWMVRWQNIAMTLLASSTLPPSLMSCSYAWVKCDTKRKIDDSSDLRPIRAHLASYVCGNQWAFSQLIACNANASRVKHFAQRIAQRISYGTNSCLLHSLMKFTLWLCKRFSHRSIKLCMCVCVRIGVPMNASVCGLYGM